MYHAEVTRLFFEIERVGAVCIPGVGGSQVDGPPEDDAAVWLGVAPRTVRPRPPLAWGPVSNPVSAFDAV